MCLEQLLYGCCEFRYIFSQDVFWTESRTEAFLLEPWGKTSVWVIQEIMLEGFLSHSALKLCGYV